MAEPEVRLLGKPSIWHGEEQLWEEWSFIVRAYFIVQNERYIDLLEAAASAPAPIVIAELGPEARPLQNDASTRATVDAAKGLLGRQRLRGGETARS